MVSLRRWAKPKDSHTINSKTSFHPLKCTFTPHLFKETKIQFTLYYYFKFFLGFLEKSIFEYFGDT